MASKITRRVAIGTVIAGLAAGPFVMYYCRKKEDVGDSIRRIMYSPHSVDTTKYNADIPAAKVEEAFDVFFNERSMWLKIRKITGKVTLSRAGIEKKLEAIVTFELEPSHVADGFPWIYHLTCFDVNTKKKIWSQSLNRNENKENFEGESIKTEILCCSQIFGTPFEFFYSLDNKRLDEAFRTYFTVTENTEAAGLPKSYAFLPISSEADRGSFFTKDGILYAIRSQHQGSNVGIQWEGEDWKSFGELRFPSHITMSQLTYADSVEKQTIIDIELSDLIVF